MLKIKLERFFLNLSPSPSPRKLMDRDKDTKYLKLPTLRILAPINELIEAFTIEEFNDKVKLNNISDLKFKCIVCPQFGANECFFERNL